MSWTCQEIISDGYGDALRACCRKCGADDEPGFGALAIGGDPRTWWRVIAVGILLRHPDVMRDAEYLPTPQFHECIARLVSALRYAVLLDEAGKGGRVH